MASGKEPEAVPIMKVNHSRREAGSNWKNVLQAENSNVILKQNGSRGIKKIKTKVKDNNMSRYIAMDCEMVGVGPEGKISMVARVSIVDQDGKVLLDKYVKPYRKVTDYRTMYSGIRPDDIANGESFKRIQSEVEALLHNKILVGHSVNRDLSVLCIKHPYRLIRDTARYKPLAQLVSNGGTPSLKRLSKVILDIDIQTGEHDSVEDARATMNIYNRLSLEWEKYIKKHFPHNNIRK